MMKLSIFVLLGLSCVCLAQKNQYVSNTTPVPILKQINRHNEDGSYSYGYEAADGSFKIETKAANGEVKGKYGYIDDTGNKREIEYGANANGFQPSGDGINVAPAAVHNAQNNYPALRDGEIDDGQYREDPAIYNDPSYNSKPSKSTQFRAQAPAYQAPTYQQQQPAYKPAQQQPTYQQQNYQQQAYEQPQTQTERPYYQSRFSAPAPAPAPAQSNYYQQPQQQPQQNFYRSQPSNNYYQSADQHNQFQGHPATNLDLSTGSYSVTYG